LGGSFKASENNPQPGPDKGRREILEAIGKPAEYIVAIIVLGGFLIAGIKYIPKGYRWLRSWTFIKRGELARLEKLVKEYEELQRIKPVTTAVRSAFIKHPEVARPIETSLFFDPRNVPKK